MSEKHNHMHSHMQHVIITEGKSTSSLCPFFFKAFLIALEKKGVGMRPIAVRCTLRCLVAEHARN